ncbi:NAD(P)H-dependent FMN reductase [Actinomycetospora succinea]|uniref:NAD(P)H-dependent FMN reductase n=1 Tax=Actinomycetospora succinea TaxID=663603 RepID=A0A4R6VCM6_9PSEU|nr:NADPH-dependent FMN reductase [Actinomycetospora succinea]TDQ60563.1 NAD(P)H-dependent FMN reductase [Actinomycetospora succinea]
MLLIGGSTRAASTTSAVLRTARDLDAGAVLYDELTALPHFDPDDDREPLPPTVERLRAAIHAADAVLFCTPEYAGALPGSFKNLLDWTVGDATPGSIYRKPVAWINASSSGTGARGAHDSLATVLGYVGADVVADACVRIPVGRDAVGTDGLVTDPELRARIGDVLATLRAAAT